MDFWRQRSIHTRRRIAALAILAVAVVVLFALVVPNLPCAFPGGSACAPDDEAAQLVPADSLAYLHASLETDSEQYERASAFAENLPLVSSQIVSTALRVPGGDAIDFEGQVRPWFGGELAVAVFGTGTEREQVLLLEAEDAEAAGEFATSIATGTAETTEYREVEIAEDRRGVASADVDGFLTFGTLAGVRAVIDVAEGAEGAEALADDETAERALDELPEERIAEAWVSQAGAQELIADPRGGLGSLSAFVAPGAAEAAAASIGFEEGGGARVAVRSLLDAERAEATPAFFSAFEEFEPELIDRLPSDALGYAGLGNPQATVEQLLAQAEAQAPGISAGFEDLVTELRKRSGVDLEGELLDSLGGEGAFALAPAPAEEAETEAEAEVPYAQFIADDVDEDAAREALAALQAPLAKAADPGSDLQAPVFTEERIGDVEASSIRISPTVELTYAVFDGLATVATDVAGIAGLTGDAGGLGSSELYAQATEDLGESDEVSLQVFMDLAGLVELAEQLGLAEDPVYAGLAGEFRALEALGMSVHADSEMISTDARLLLGD